MHGLEELFSGCAIVSDFWLWREMVFGFTSISYLEHNRHMMGCRNRYFEGAEEGHMTPPGYPNFNSHVKNLRVKVFQTDGRTETFIRGGFRILSVPPG